MSGLFKYTISEVEAYVAIPHIVEVKYDPNNNIVHIHLVNGSIIDITTQTEQLYEDLVKKMKDCWSDKKR